MSIGSEEFEELKDGSGEEGYESGVVVDCGLELGLDQSGANSLAE